MKGVEFITVLFDLMPKIAEDISSAEEICLMANEGMDLVQMKVGRPSRLSK